MKKSFAIIGLGRFGMSLVENLAKSNADIIAIDTDENAVSKVTNMITHAYICDSTNEAALKEIGVQSVDHAIVAFGENIQATILTTIILKDFEIPRITVRVDDEHYSHVIMKLGATDVISPQKIAGEKLAYRLSSDTFEDYFRITKEFSIVEILVRKDFETISLIDLNARRNYDINILIIHRDSEYFSPTGDDEIRANDRIFVIGKSENLSAFDRAINETKQ